MVVVSNFRAVLGCFGLQLDTIFLRLAAQKRLRFPLSRMLLPSQLAHSITGKDLSAYIRISGLTLIEFVLVYSADDISWVFGS